LDYRVFSVGVRNQLKAPKNACFYNYPIDIVDFSIIFGIYILALFLAGLLFSIEKIVVLFCSKVGKKVFCGFLNNIMVLLTIELVENVNAR